MMKKWQLVVSVVAMIGPITALACGETFLDVKGTFTSPEDYLHDKECVYNILGSEDARIKLHCSEISLPLSEGCINASFSINGVHMCGMKKLLNVYGKGSLTIRYTTNRSVNSKHGFRCSYKRISGGKYVERNEREDSCIAPPPTVTSCTAQDTEYNYDEVLHKSLLFYEAQRSGFLPSTQRVKWRGDSATDDALDADTQQKVDLEGGYYDAGDYVKFGYPMASAATVLAWGAVDYAEAYKAAGEMGNLKVAVKWATDYFIKAHVAPTTFYGQVGKGWLDHRYMGRPEDMTMSRPAYKITENKPGSDLAGETAAALAAASILFSDSDASYSAECLLHARQLYDFATNFQGKYAESITDAANFYNSYGVYDDELAWAAVWLYRATGEKTYLDQAKNHYIKLNIYNVGEFSWAEKAPGAMVLLVQLSDASDRATYAQNLQNFCDNMIDHRQRTPKGLLFLNKWGSLRLAANVAFVCLRAADLGIRTDKYREFGKQQIHYILGSTGRSFVVGFGQNPPQRPHHRSSFCKYPPEPCKWNDFHSSAPSSHVLYGALVGGPDENDKYTDARSDYISNEVACDYNAGFQSAVAALRQAGCSNDGSTTDGGFSSCASLIQTKEWTRNFQANLVLKVPSSTLRWTIALTFSDMVQKLRVWDAVATATPSTHITLSSKSHNGHQAAGNILTIDLIVTYDDAKPKLTGVIFNRTPFCVK